MGTPELSEKTRELQQDLTQSLADQLQTATDAELNVDATAFDDEATTVPAPPAPVPAPVPARTAPEPGPLKPAKLEYRSTGTKDLPKEGKTDITPHTPKRVGEYLRDQFIIDRDWLTNHESRTDKHRLVMLGGDGTSELYELKGLPFDPLKPEIDKANDPVRRVLGVFSLRSYKVDDVIGQFVGSVLDIAKEGYRDLVDGDHLALAYGMEWEKDGRAYHVVPGHNYAFQLMHFVNASDWNGQDGTANVEARPISIGGMPVLQFYACQSITRGQELLCKYGKLYYKNQIPAPPGPRVGAGVDAFVLTQAERRGITGFDDLMYGGPVTDACDDAFFEHAMEGKDTPYRNHEKFYNKFKHPPTNNLYTVRQPDDDPVTGTLARVDGTDDDDKNKRQILFLQIHEDLRDALIGRNGVPKDAQASLKKLEGADVVLLCKFGALVALANRSGDGKKGPMPKVGAVLHNVYARALAHVNPRDKLVRCYLHHKMFLVLQGMAVQKSISDEKPTRTLLQRKANANYDQARRLLDELPGDTPGKFNMYDCIMRCEKCKQANTIAAMRKMVQVSSRKRVRAGPPGSQPPRRRRNTVSGTMQASAGGASSASGGDAPSASGGDAPSAGGGDAPSAGGGGGTVQGLQDAIGTLRF